MKFKTDFLLPVMVLFSGNSHALEWLFEPNVSANERYDDNVTMQVNSANMISSMISTLSPGILLGYSADNNELQTRFKWNELMYHSASALDFSEKMLDINHQYQAERFKTTLEASYNEQSSINTQLVDPRNTNFNNVISSSLVPQTTRSISPSVLINLTARNALQFSYSYQDVAYERPADLQNISYSDYTSQQISATAIHTFSERLTLNATGAYSLFESSNNRLYGYLGTNPINLNIDQKSTTFFYQAGFQYAFSESTQLSISAGMRNTANDSNQFFTLADSGQPLSDLPPISSTASGHVFSASYTKNFERGKLSLNAGQQLNPASSGQQQQTTSFSAQGNYNLTERWSAGVNANYLISDSTSTVNSGNQAYNRTYSTLSPNIHWQWTPEMSLQLSYTYRQNDYTSSHQTALGNSIQLQFSYQPQINRQVK